MLIPLNRPSGSSLRLRYRGTIVAGEATAVYPKTNATYASDAPIVGSNFLTGVRFALFNPSDLADTAKRLDGYVYDDEQPAGAAPHGTVLVTAGGAPGTDKSMNAQTWAQNVQIHYNKIDPNVVIADAAVSVDNDILNGAQLVLDSGVSSGLGTNTGLPVVAILFTVALNDGARQSFDVDLTFEITQSSTR